MRPIEELLSHRSEIDAELRKHRGPATVMLIDLGGSGDIAETVPTQEDHKIILPLVQQHKGVIVRTIAGSAMAYFPDPAQAVACGVDIQKAIARNNTSRDPKERIHARVALHHGLAYLRGADVFGDVLKAAARLMEWCLPAQILASEALHLSAQHAVTLPFRPVETVSPQGQSAEKVYEIIWTDQAAYDKLRAALPTKEQASTGEDFSSGRYIILNELGRGAMGTVYKAYDRHIGRMVALKTMPLEVDEKEKPELVARLKQESRAAGILDHPNIVTVYDVGEEAGMFYFTMQYVEGKTLASIRAEKKLLPIEQVLDIMEQVLAAIGFAHGRGVIHRDIKPSNLMLTAQGTAKVMDFGIAKFGNAGLTQAGIIVGTPSYLAPEQAAGRRIDIRADIFALGSVFYELLTAERAFPGESATSIIFKILNEEPVPPRVIEPSLPSALDVIVRKALAKDPGHRFQSCEEMRAAIQECRKHRNATVTSPAAPAVRKIAVSETRVIEPPRRRKPMWPMAAVVITLLAAAVGFAPLRTRLAMPPGPVAATMPPPPPPFALTPTPGESTSLEAQNPAETKPEESAVKPPDGEQIAAGEPSPAQLDERAKRTRSAPKRLNPVRRARAAEDANGGDSSLAAFDTPTLLKIADNYAGRGEYTKAVYTYRQVLLRDARNVAAKQGLRRAQEAQGIR